MTQGAEQAKSENPASALTVLVVDDNEFNRDIVSEHMEGEGHKVVSFERPLDAMDYLMANPSVVQVLLVDYMMPGMTGLEFLQRLRADARFAALPALMVSAHPDKDTLLAKHQDCNVAGWVTKPFEREQLLSTLRQAVSPA